ncbi:MAG: CD0415/CD1112 family protein [Clostridiales bacterium]|nr:CD0415/CD1112 family protein [Clostridiales bacterium]
MFGILDAIEDWLRQLLISIISSNLTTLFDDVNTKVRTIATEVGQTPSGWNSSIYNMVHSLSENVMVPIAGIIITFVLCYELITVITEKNNMHDIDTFLFFKYIFKACIAVYLVSNTFTITMAVFDVAQNVVSHAGGIISGNTNIDITSTIATMQTSMETMELGGLVQLAVETMIISLCLKIMSILITVILYGRMIEIYLTISVAPIPFATMTNREWGTVGTNYFKSLFALGFQGFLMMICVAIYAVLVNSMTIAADIHSALFSIAAYTVILCFSLMKTGSLSKSLFGAH